MMTVFPICERCACDVVPANGRCPWCGDYIGLPVACSHHATFDASCPGCVARRYRRQAAAR